MDIDEIWESYTDFERYFIGTGWYSDGDLEKDADGEYIYPMTRGFHECWLTAKGELPE